MSQIKGYKAEKVARDAKEKLISDYESCKCDLAEIRQHEKEIADILDVVHSSEVLGSSSYDIFIYNNLVNVFVRFDLNSKEMKERVI